MSGAARLLRDPRLWLVLLAFALRLGWVLAVPSRPVGDFALYREAAAFLAAHGRLDPEFIYMPGYVAVLAAIEALGGGLLAAKLLGVVAATVVVWAAGDVAAVLAGRRAGTLATALGAVWPAGIAVTSVTGTDVPAAALILAAVAALVRLGPRRPWLAAVACGLLLGLGAWVRAVAVPLGALTICIWRAHGQTWARAAARAAVTSALALLVLVPWAVRNRLFYGPGELFFTDSHGGHTALVGANPNSEGTYSRSLNVMFTWGTGYKLFEIPARHRASDRAAYALAGRWSAEEPAYAVGLLAAKADRLLGHERNLLYWPIYRAGVLDGQGRAGRVKAFLAAHQTAVERLADGWWWLLVGLGAAGVAVTAGRRRQPETVALASPSALLALLPLPLALAAIYTLFFSEVRYHLAIAPFLIPFAAVAIDRGIAGARRRFAGDAWTVAVAAAALLLAFAGWHAMRAVGARLRANHRWAVVTCRLPVPPPAPGFESGPDLCSWRRVLPASGPSPVRGAWDGVGLRLDGARDGEVLASAGTELALGPGRYRVRAVASLSGPPGGAEVAVALRAGGRVVARVLFPGPDGETELPIAGAFDHQGAAGAVLTLEVEQRAGSGAPAPGAGVWLSGLVVERGQGPVSP